MENQKIAMVMEAIAYIESHLNEDLALDTVANAVHYSKYHLHRIFVDTVGVTLHDYIQRRKLTEAAKLLVCSGRPILEIALNAGYGSQQAFSQVFKSMYKRTPAKYREQGVFYPLQLEFVLKEEPSLETVSGEMVVYANDTDLSDWMRFAALVVDEFPGFEEKEHRETIQSYVKKRQALIVRDGDTIIGAAAFSSGRGRIDFLAVHPQYRNRGVEEALLEFLMRHIFARRAISITTFREGDPADKGQRAVYRRLGFAEEQLLTEFGYPTQRMILPPSKEEQNHE